MSSNSHEVAKHADYWIKVNIGIEIHLKPALLDVLYNTHNDPSYVGLPRNRALLGQHMLQFKQTREQALKHIVRPAQWESLCPADGLPNPENWDITLIVTVIINVLGIPPPQGGWKQARPLEGDSSIGAAILYARWLRNKVKHGSIQDVKTSIEFNPLWSLLKRILVLLKYDQKKMIEFEELEDGNLKMYTSETMQFLEDRQVQLEHDVNEMTKNDQADVAQIQTQLNNLHVAMKHVRPNFPEDKQQNMISSVTRLATMFVESTNLLNARLKKLEQMQTNDFEYISEGAILDEVFEVVADMLTRSEWERLMNTLQLTFKEKMGIFFATRSIDILRSRDLSWLELKHRLLQLDRPDVVKKIITDSFVTTGFKSAMLEHKDNLRQSYMNKRFVKPFLGATGETELDDKDFGDAFVELAIIKGKSVDDKFLNSNRDYHLQQVQLQKDFIQLGDLVKSDDRFIIISGVPGIGKSTLVKKLILEWEQGQLLNGVKGAPIIRLLFPILCRELNTLDIATDATPEEILCQLFPDFFTDLRMLKEVNEHILFLVDGVDELRSIDSIKSLKRPPAVDLLYSLMNPKFLGHHKCILVGRPRAARMLRSFFKSTYQYESKKVEVCGFSKKNVETYVMKQFSEDHQLGNDILQKIRASPITDGLSRIPLYSWVLTSIYKDNPFMEVPMTATELLLYSFLVFIRRQKEKQGLMDNHWSIKKLTEDEDVMTHIMTLSQYSYKTLLNSEIIFEAEETPSLLEIEKIGLLVKSTRRESDVTTYQFQHLTFQELFSAVHILRMGKVDTDIIDEPIMQACLTIVAGLEGIAYGQPSTTNKILKEFLLKLLSPQSTASVNGEESIMRITGLLQKSWMNTWQRDGESNEITVNISDLFVEAFFENQSSCFPHAVTIPKESVMNYEKDPNSLPLTQYPLYRLYYFTHILLVQNPLLTISFLPLLGTSFGMVKIGQLLLRCQNIYFNSNYINQDDFINLLTLIFEKLYKLPHFKKVTVNFQFMEMDRFLLDLFTSLFRTKYLESLSVTSVEIKYKPQLTWSRILTQLQQSTRANLRELTLVKCSLTDDILKDSISELGHLSHLDLSYNDLSQLSLDRLLEVVTPTSSLEIVNFSWNNFRKHSKEELENFTSIIPCKENLKPLCVLDISQCGNTESPKEFLRNVFKVVKCLRVDRWTYLDVLLDELRGMRLETDFVQSLETISICVMDIENMVDIGHPLEPWFKECDVTLVYGNAESEDELDFNRLPGWFEFGIES